MRELLIATIVAGAGACFAGLARAQEQAQPPWTLMIYGAVDNDAEGHFLEFIDGVRAALDDDPGMQLVLFIDRSEGFSNDSSSLGEDFSGARVYQLHKDSADRLDVSDYFPGMNPGEEHELDSADPRTLGRFVSLCKEQFPAQRTGLMIYSHADGSIMCPDDGSGNEMGIPALSGLVGAEASVDFLALELCHMGGIEIAYQWRPGNGGFSAETLVAIPNAGAPLDWHRAFARIRSKGHATAARGDVHDPASMSAAEFGRLLIEEGHAGRREWVEEAKSSGLHDLTDPAVIAHAREAAGCYDLGAAEGAKRAIDRLARALAQDDGMGVLLELRGSSDEDRMLNYAGPGKFQARPYVDLFELLELIAASPELGDDVRSSARAAGQAVDELVVASFGLEEGFEGFKPDRNGIFIVFPDGQAWPGLSWYTPLESEPAGPHGRWSFLADGATPGNGKVENWFELLDLWFDDPSAGSGGLNRYSW